MQFDDHGLKGGIWRGRLQGGRGAPGRVTLIQHGEVLAEAALTPEAEDAWLIQVPVPPAVLSDGLQTLLLAVHADGAEDGATIVARLPVMAGRPLDEDLTTEIATLRAELELVKRTLRALGAGLARH